MNNKKISLMQDSTGGIMASLLGISKSIAFGMVVFAPLGPAYAPIGAAAGLVSMALTNLIPAWFNGGGIVNSGPYSLSSLMLAAAASQLIIQVSPEILLTLIFFTVFLSGLLQFLLGIFRFGTLAKYIPYPVLAGLMNGSGILILVSQVKPVFLADVSGLIRHPMNIFTASSIVTISTAAFTIFSYQFVRRFKWRFLAPVFSLLGGALFFYLLVWITGISTQSLVIGRLPLAVPLPTALNGLVSQMFQADIRKLIFEIVLPSSIGIALVNSLSSFLAQNESDSLLHQRSDSNSGLAGQGISNIAAAFFGGISGAGSNSRTAAAFDYGARTRISQIAGGLFTVVIILFSSPVLSPLPLSVLGGVLILLSISLFDKWVIIQLIESMEEKGSRRSEKIFPVLVSIIVTVIMVIFGIVEAVFAGVIFSMIIFVSSMSRGIISREYTGLKMRSNTERPRREVDLLDRHGSRIHILELEGYLYFGTADTLLHRVEQLLKEEAAMIIIDLRRLKNIDTTGVVAIRQASDRCRNAGCSLMLSSVNADSPFRRTEVSGVLLFDQFDDCLASAEDSLISEESDGESSGRLDAGELDILSGLTSGEIKSLMKYLEEKSFSKGEKIFSEGENGDSVFFILQGRADLYMKMADGTLRRFYRLSRGAVFGEMSMIDGRTRSADVCAETDIICLVLTIDSLEKLRKDHPSIAYSILTGVAALLSRRIRINISIIAQLR